MKYIILALLLVCTGCATTKTNTQVGITVNLPDGTGTASITSIITR